MSIEPGRNTDRTNTVHNDNNNGGGGRVIMIIIAIAVIGLGLAFATGMISMSTEGNLEAPKVAVTGGEVPDVDVNTATVAIGTKSVTVEVPEVSVDKSATTDSN